MRAPPPIAPPRLGEKGPPPLPGARHRPASRRQAKAEKVLTPDELDRYTNLLVFARSKVEGYFIGKHKSPYRGSSAEFADYKEYVAGDDLQRLDWKVYGRTRRLYLRQFEEETDMTIYLLVDISGSMGFRGAAKETKAFRAAKIAAALAYLMIKQGDQVALGLFHRELSEFIPAGGTLRKLHEITTALEAIRPDNETGLSQALTQAEAVFRRRGRVVILSDFLDDPAPLLDALGRLLHRRFEILLLQVLDPHERDLPVAAASQYVDMESGETMRVDPTELRVAYRARMDAHLREIARQCAIRQVDHCLVDSAEPYHRAIEAFLGFRRKTL